MKRYFHIFTLAALSIIISGCSNLAVMKQVERIGSSTDKNTALVNFVRPAIFLGDGVDFEVWDGSSFIGTLSAGTMLQYVAQPGEHPFMINPTRGGAWAYKNLAVTAGSVYYLKPNITVVAGLKIGVADSTDSRIEVWNRTLTPMAIDKSESKEVPKESIAQANENLSRFKQRQ